MKKDTHPKYTTDCLVTCACGNSFVSGSTATSLHVDICSACHPAYTGKQKFVDTEGRIDKYKKKVAEAKKLTAAQPKKKK